MKEATCNPLDGFKSVNGRTKIKKIGKELIITLSKKKSRKEPWKSTFSKNIDQKEQKTKGTKDKVGGGNE